MSDALLLAFGDRVRVARKSAGLSQERLGEVSGLHRTYIGHVERGEVNPTLVSIVRIATALTADPGELTAGLEVDLDQARSRPRTP